MSIILPVILSGIYSNDFTYPKVEKRIVIEEENPYPNVEAIPLPEGYRRIVEEKSSFGEWLRNIPLRKNNIVYLYDGSIKKDQSSQFAVLDLAIGKKNLQQCADAVMRLRAEYLYSQKKFDEIVFQDNSNVIYKFGTPINEEHFHRYLDEVFARCGTLSLEKELLHIKNVRDIKIGDVLIQGGSPGHAMIVIDMAQNGKGNKICMLAQGYMPAQDIHVVINPMNSKLSPWYEINDNTYYTPGWIFPPGHFKTW